MAAPVGALAALGVGREDGFDTLEGLGSNELRMVTLVLDATPGDVADVVAIAQDRLQLIWPDRTGGPFGGRPLAQAAQFELPGEPVEAAPVAAGVGSEGPAHERRPFRIEDDGLRPAVASRFEQSSD